MTQALHKAVEAVLRDAAARAVMPHYQRLESHQIDAKAADDVVTVADKEAELILAEGLDNVYKRHAMLAKATRAAIRALGLKLFTEDRCASKTLTGIWGPEGINPDTLRKIIKDQYGVTFAGGQGSVKGKIFRIAHMGFCDKMDIIIAIGALEMGLAQLGWPVQLGAGVKAAQEVFLGEA